MNEVFIFVIAYERFGLVGVAQNRTEHWKGVILSLTIVAQAKARQPFGLLVVGVKRFSYLSAFNTP